MDLLKVCRSHSGEDKLTVTGVLALEIPGDAPCAFNICAQAGGAYLCWFGDGENFHLYALVNESDKHVVSMPCTHWQEFQVKLTELQKEMGE